MRTRKKRLSPRSPPIMGSGNWVAFRLPTDRCLVNRLRQCCVGRPDGAKAQRKLALTSESTKSREHKCALRLSVKRLQEGNYADFVDSEVNASFRCAFAPSGRPTQHCRRRFTKQRSVGNRKATQFPEPIIGGDLGDSRFFRVRIPQGPPCQIHSPQPQISFWAHAQIL